jgi:hypothetical protein
MTVLRNVCGDLLNFHEPMPLGTELCSHITMILNIVIHFILSYNMGSSRAV